MLLWNIFLLHMEKVRNAFNIHDTHLSCILYLICISVMKAHDRKRNDKLMVSLCVSVSMCLLPIIILNPTVEHHINTFVTFSSLSYATLNFPSHSLLDIYLFVTFLSTLWHI
jgi:multisubunit Na+/H+ antiporter MnhB subunit